MTIKTLLILTLLAGTAFAAWGGELADVTLPDTDEVDGQDLVLNGMGLRTKLGIKVYVTGLYLPGKGTEVVVKGQLKGIIGGKDFADALFACWIGPQPPNEEFKNGLLGR